MVQQRDSKGRFTSAATNGSTEPIFNEEEIMKSLMARSVLNDIVSNATTTRADLLQKLLDPRRNLGGRVWLPTNSGFNQ